MKSKSTLYSKDQKCGSSGRSLNKINNLNIANSNRDTHMSELVQIPWTKELDNIEEQDGPKCNLADNPACEDSKSTDKVESIKSGTLTELLEYSDTSYDGLSKNDISNTTRRPQIIMTNNNGNSFNRPSDYEEIFPRQDDCKTGARHPI